MNFAKFARTPFLQNTTGRLLLIIAVSVVMKGELANETVNYDTKLKPMYNLSQKCQFQKRAALVKFELVSEAVFQIFFKIGVLKIFANPKRKRRHILKKSQSGRLC